MSATIDLKRLFREITKNVGDAKWYYKDNNTNAVLLNKATTMLKFVTYVGADILGPLDVSSFYNKFDETYSGPVPTEHEEMTSFLKALVNDLWIVCDEIHETRRCVKCVSE